MKSFKHSWLALLAIGSMGVANADPITIDLTGTVDDVDIFFGAPFGLVAGDTFTVTIGVESTLAAIAGGNVTFTEIMGNLLSLVFDFNGTLFSLANATSFPTSLTTSFNELFDLSYISDDFAVGTGGNGVLAFDFGTGSTIFGTLNLTSFTVVTVDGDGGPTVSVPEPGTLALLGCGLLGMAMTRRRRQVQKAA